VGIDINQFIELNKQWNEIARKLEECREQLLFLGEGAYRTESAHWFVACDGSIISQLIIDRFQQRELFKDDDS